MQLIPNRRANITLEACLLSCKPHTIRKFDCILLINLVSNQDHLMHSYIQVSDMNCSISIYDELYQSGHMLSFFELYIMQTTKSFKRSS